jgi:tRNA-2-methylthio-N6-dimethylallyladenosine synthase
MKVQNSHNQLKMDVPLDLQSKSKQGGTHNQVLRFFLKTYGCQMNVADSDTMARELAGMGLEAADQAEDADVIVVNTCTVRDHAEHRALSYVGRLKPYKARNKSLVIIVAGCAAERLGEKNIRSRFPIVDAVVGAKGLERFPGTVRQLLRAGEGQSVSPSLPRRPRAFVTVMRGCENFCSYCIVPFVRGKEISRPVPEILREVVGLAGQGVREITLLGQNVNSYAGYGSADAVGGTKTDFAGLLGLVGKVDGISRIRFMTSHPKDLGQRLMDAMAGVDKVCEHLHLPLQSGSDLMLAAMNRGYTSSQYRKLIETLRSKVPGIAVSTDLIIGYPGESDRDFRETLTMVKELEFDFLFAFKYSPRAGTEAERVTDSVPREVKEQRLEEILALSYGIAARKNIPLIGTVEEVLVEETNNGTASGHTRTHKKASFPAGSVAPGNLVNVRVTACKANSLTGEQIHA